MGDIQPDLTASENLVTIEFADGYDVILGPPGARGMSETGRQVEPPGPVPSVDERLRDSIRATAVQSGLTWREEHHNERREVDRFDFGTVTSFHDWLYAAGGGAAALAMIRGCHPLDS